MGGTWIVGQSPIDTQRVDDKFQTNARLRDCSLPVAAALLAAHEARDGVTALDALDASGLKKRGLAFPLVVKPVRGRGSQGVTVVADLAALRAAADALIASGRFGGDLIVEQYLAGEELTVTVMPPASAGPDGVRRAEPWALPPVRRFNHHAGVAPYNGDVAVSANSQALTPEEAQAPAVATMLAHCVEAARIVEARAPIRIDCRADAHGAMLLFDLNMKPNLTGAGRPGRDDQDSLTTLAARAIGWDYADLLTAMLDAAWREPIPGGVVGLG